MKKLVRLSDAPKKKVEWFWPGYIPCGGLTMLSGDPENGKSMGIIEVAARQIRGEPMPFSNETVTAGGVIYLSAEDPVDEITNRFIAAGADINRVFVVGPDEITLPDDLDVLEKTIHDENVRLIVLDPLESYLSGSIGSRTVVRSALDPLKRLVEKDGVAVVGIRHLTKSTSTRSFYRGTGSVAITAAARSELLVTVSRENPEQRVLTHMKCNLGPKSPSINFSLVPVGKSVKVEWLGFSGITAEDALEQPNKRECAVRNEAKELLVAVLIEGPVLAGEVSAIAQRATISRATLLRAKYDLGIVSKRSGFGKGTQFFWDLPDRDDLVDELSEEIFDGDDAGQPKRLPYCE